MEEFLVKNGSHIIGRCIISPQEGADVCRTENGQHGIDNVLKSPSIKHDITVIEESSEDYYPNYNSIVTFTPKEQISKDLIIKLAKELLSWLSYNQFKIIEDSTTGKYAVYALLSDDFMMDEIINRYLFITEEVHFLSINDMGEISYCASFSSPIKRGEGMILRQEVIKSRNNEGKSFSEEYIFDMTV